MKSFGDPGTASPSTGKEREERARRVKGTRIVLGQQQCSGQGRGLGRLARALGKPGSWAPPSCNHRKVCT